MPQQHNPQRNDANLPEWAEPEVREYEDGQEYRTQNDNGQGPCEHNPDVPPCQPGHPGNPPGKNVPIEGTGIELVMIVAGMFIGTYFLSNQTQSYDNGEGNTEDEATRQ